MNKKAVAIMGYFGNLSVNHYKFKGRFTRPEVKDWMDELGWVLKGEHIETWRQPITVSIRGVFKNLQRCPDLHNLLKVTCDAVQSLTGIDDKTYRTETGDALIDKKQDPHLVITIKEADGNDKENDTQKAEANNSGAKTKSEVTDKVQGEVRTLRRTPRLARAKSKSHKTKRNGRHNPRVH